MTDRWFCDSLDLLIGAYLERHGGDDISKGLRDLNMQLAQHLRGRRSAPIVEPSSDTTRATDPNTHGWPEGKL